MDKALIGLGGVALGVLLSIFKDWLLQSRKTKKEYEYLTIRVACILDRFAYECAEVARDDGMIDGQPPCAKPITAPALDLRSLDVEWKSLPCRLTYEALGLPNKIERANKIIDSTFYHVSTLPDHKEGFEERQFQYSQLGICALELAANLSTYGKLPSFQYSDSWDPNKTLRETLNEIQSRRKKRDE